MSEFTPAQIKAIRKIVRNEIDIHEKKLEHKEKMYQQELKEVEAEATMTARDWGDLD